MITHTSSEKARGRIPAGAAAAAGKKGGKKPNASNFIRAQPRDLPAKEVVQRGARQGFKFSSNLVYLVRNRPVKSAGEKSIKKSIQKSGRGAARKPAQGRGIGQPKKGLGARRGGSGRSRITSAATTHESSFRELVQKLGVGRAKSLMLDMEHRLQSLMSKH